MRRAGTGEQRATGRVAHAARLYLPRRSGPHTVWHLQDRPSKAFALHARTAASALHLLLDLRERRRIARVLDLSDDRRGEVDDAVEILVVDLVGGIGRLVVVGVRAGEEGEAGDARQIERRDIGRLIRI